MHSMGRVVLLAVLHAIAGSSVALAEDDARGQLKQEIAALHGQLPVMVDNEVRLDWVDLDGDRVHYYYTLVEVESLAGRSEPFREAVAPTLRDNYCTSEQARTLRELSMAATYHYQGTRKDALVAVSVSGSDC